jgi:hypothetical protein
MDSLLIVNGALIFRADGCVGDIRFAPKVDVPRQQINITEELSPQKLTWRRNVTLA